MNYKRLMYEPVTDRFQITTQQLGLTHYEVVLPRMTKQTDTQQQRTRKKKARCSAPHGSATR